MTPDRSVDLLFLACNRLAFTRETFNTLLANTDWNYVRELVVMDDGSRDGSREWLAVNVHRAPVPARMVCTHFASPVAAMSHFIRGAQAPLLAKTDNDAMLPPGWLHDSLGVFDRQPELSLLGLEALYPVERFAASRSYSPAAFVSGLGIYRREAFLASQPAPFRRWFGFEDWQQKRPELVRGWITPAIPVFLLDRVPFEPWSGFTCEYVNRRWQRAWPPYPPDSALWKWKWPDGVANADDLSPSGPLPADTPRDPFAIVIPSARAANLVPCVRAILDHEPQLDPRRIIIIDDGARAEAEAFLPGVRWISGEKPFVFARNANAGIRAAACDVILWNDDALLATPQGLTHMHEQLRDHPDIGLCSAAIRGIVGNPNQLVHSGDAFRREPNVLCFICVYLPERVYRAAGPLDERFQGYGFEDNDYSKRVRAAGFDLAVFDGCVADHSGRLASTFRTRPDVRALFDMNRRLFEEKHRGANVR